MKTNKRFRFGTFFIWIRLFMFLDLIQTLGRNVLGASSWSYWYLSSEHLVGTRANASNHTVNLRKFRIVNLQLTKKHITEPTIMKHAPVKTKMIAYQHDDNFHQFPFTSTKLTPKGASLLVYWPKSWLIFSRVNSFPLILGDLARFFSIQLPWTSTAPSKRRSWKLVGETMKWYPPWNRHLPETWESKGTPPNATICQEIWPCLGDYPIEH